MALRKNTTTEFKVQYTDDIKKTVIAFANTKGGAIYIGIADNGSVVGIEDTDDVMLRLSNSVRNTIKPDVTMFVDYRVENMEGKQVICAEVQKGTSSPYYLSGKGLRPEGVFIRQGASSVPASQTAIRNMIKETDGDRYEQMRSLNQNLTFQFAAKEFEEKGISFGDSQQTTLGIKTIEGIYTNLGLLLSDQCVHTVKTAVFEDVEKEIFRDQYEFTGSLLKQLNDVFGYIDRYNRTRAEYSGLQRIDQRDYPVEAIREALLNSLVHRDYAFSSSTLISIFENRIEFVSVGGLAKGITIDDIMLGISIARNEKLANIFYRLNLIESYGTGIPKMFRSYEDSDLTPTIETSDNVFKIILPNKNIAKEHRAFTEPSFSPDGAAADESGILKLFASKKPLTRVEIETALSLSQATTLRLLKKLEEKGNIKKVGKGKNTKYLKKDN